MKILVNEKELKFLKAICTLYKSSSYLDEEQKKHLIDKVLRPYVIRYNKSLEVV